MNDIHTIKEKLILAEEADRRHQQLANDRLALEEALQKVQSQQMCSPLEEHEEVSQLKAKKREVDHLLDEVESSSPKQISELKEKLINAIIRTHPDQLSKYREFESKTSFLRELDNRTSEAIHSCQRVAQPLHQALQAWQCSLLKRTLRFIFGQSPVEEITQNLDWAGERSSAAMTAVKSYAEHDSEDPRAQALEKQLSLFFQAFLAEREEKWSFTKLTTLYSPSLDALTGFIEQLGVQQQINQETLLQQEHAFFHWIDQF